MINQKQLIEYTHCSYPVLGQYCQHNCTHKSLRNLFRLLWNCLFFIRIKHIHQKSPYSSNVQHKNESLPIRFVRIPFNFFSLQFELIQTAAEHSECRANTLIEETKPNDCSVPSNVIEMWTAEHQNQRSQPHTKSFTLNRYLFSSTRCAFVCTYRVYSICFSTVRAYEMEAEPITMTLQPFAWANAYLFIGCCVVSNSILFSIAAVVVDVVRA